MRKTPKILIITAGGTYAWIIANALAEKFDGVEIVKENPESKRLFLTRRARKLGWVQTAGQFVTMAISRFGKSVIKRRQAEILSGNKLLATLAPEIPLTNVSSANGADCLAVLTTQKPGVVVLVGCRILSKTTLAKIPCPVINYHSGINPKYRGLAGGWWARATGDHENYGTTVHLVDAGVDTGSILYQAFFKPHPDETLLSDSLAMAANSRAIVIQAVQDALNGSLTPKSNPLPSVQRFHPPIWTYIWIGLTKHIW